MGDEPVVVAGAGPVGLTVALELQRRGIPVVVLEQRPVLAKDPRATTVQPRCLEIFDGLDVLDPLIMRGRVVRSLQYWENGELLADLDYALLSDATTTPFRLHVAQWDLCEVLVAALKPGTIHWGRRLAGIEPSAEGLRVQVGDGTVLEASWVVGADGMGSVVRRLAAIGQETGLRESFFTCESDLSLAEHLPPNTGDCAYLLDHEDWTLVMRLRDCYRLLFRIPRGHSAAEAVSEPHLGRWMERFFPELPLAALRNRAAYTVQQRLADTFVHGRILLAGDAAHSAFPVGGMAMNAGLEDAHLLARALDLSTNTPLQSYAVDRPHQIREGVLATTATASRTLAARGPLQRWKRSGVLGSLDDPEQAHLHLMGSSMLLPGASYRGELG